MSAVIIMCSKFDSKENIDIAYKSGMKDIHPKPIEDNRLNKILLFLIIIFILFFTL